MSVRSEPTSALIDSPPVPDAIIVAVTRVMIACAPPLPSSSLDGHLLSREGLMAGPGALKRIKEIKRQEKSKDKAADREKRRRDKAARERAGEKGIDPDIAGIVPGPQPPIEG